MPIVHIISIPMDIVLVKISSNKKKISFFLMIIDLSVVFSLQDFVNEANDWNTSPYRENYSHFV
jgi:hypothetical protein